MGTPEFAVPSLKALHETFGVSAVVTVADKPQGRGRAVKPSAVKQAAIDLGIETILQPVKLRDPEFIAALEALQPDIICVIAFRILPSVVYSKARLGAFNVHGSILPKFRGAAPINHAIIQGEKESGVTSFLLNDVVDTGKILLKKTTAVADGTTVGELYAAMMPLAAECAAETCAHLLAGSAQPLAQDDSLASPAPKVYRFTAEIDWDKPATEVRQWILGHSPVPGAWTTWNGAVLKVYRASLSNSTCATGKFCILDGSLIVGCADGALELDEIQMPGKRSMLARDVLRGYRGPEKGTLG